MKGNLFIPAVLFAGSLFAGDFSIPATLYPVPEKRSLDPAAIKKAEPYLKKTPEQLASLVPAESPGPVLNEVNSYIAGQIQRCKN
ncbi:MAG: hypothetical protein E7055_10750 [Lentisphaerae bacterium]|nr:hypothetical protein [Lentisphaerota bacterium]